MKGNRTNARAKAIEKGFLRGIYLSILVAAVIAAIFLIMRVTARKTIADDAPRRYKYYTSITVEKGDSLWSIAEEHAGTEYKDLYEYINEVMEINGLKNTDIKAGYNICIPYYSDEYK